MSEKPRSPAYHCKNCGNIVHFGTAILPESDNEKLRCPQCAYEETWAEVKDRVRMMPYAAWN